MFVTKRSYDSILLENENLATQLKEVETALFEKEKAIDLFLQSMDDDLANILTQHDSVNDQHSILAELVENTILRM